VTLNQALVFHRRRGPEGPAAGSEATGSPDVSVPGNFGLVGARADVVAAGGHDAEARAANGRVARFSRTELGLLCLIVFDLLLGLGLRDGGLIGWGVGCLAIASAIACWRSGAVRMRAPASPRPVV
jgi:hypothetical protein